MKIDSLKWDAGGLIPAAVIDADSKELLTLAYVNRESLEISIAEGQTCFWSRSRGELWRKGKTSGNVQRIVSITADCDGDALKILVRKEGPACHTGEDSCFFNLIHENENEPSTFSLDALAQLLHERKENPREGSYTTYLFEKGREKILKKVGEETTEVIIGASKGDRAETIYEIADLCYHTLVLMEEMGIPLSEIASELASRHVIDKKVKQEKMV